MHFVVDLYVFEWQIFGRCFKATFINWHSLLCSVYTVSAISTLDKVLTHTVHVVFVNAFFLPWFCYVNTMSRIKWFDPWHNCNDARNKSWFLKGWTVVVFFASTYAEQKKKNVNMKQRENEKKTYKKQIEKSAQRQRTATLLGFISSVLVLIFCFVALLPLLPLLPFLSFQLSLSLSFPLCVFSSLFWALSPSTLKNCMKY